MISSAINVTRSRRVTSISISIGISISRVTNGT